MCTLKPCLDSESSQSSLSPGSKVEMLNSGLIGWMPISLLESHPSGGIWDGMGWEVSHNDGHLLVITYH